MPEVDGSYLVARTLKEENTECLFYLMGGPNYEIINNSEDLGIKTYDFRHEQAAAMAAHGYSRVTGKPGVTTAASGPGTLNLLTGQYNAFVDCAPMITLGGAGPIKDFYRGGFQEIDQVSIFEKVSKATFRPTSASQYPQVISHAFRISTTGRPGPVYIDCNEDVLYEKINEKDTSIATRSKESSGPSGDSDLIKKTINLLSKSNSPIIFAGGGTFWSDASRELKEFIDISGIPKMTFKKPEHIKNDKVNTTSHNIKSLTNGVYIPDDEKYYGQLWKLAWVNDVDKWYSYGKNSFGLIKNASRGHVFTGSSDWKNYSVTSKIMFRLASSGGLVIRSQGLQRYYSLEIKSTNKLQINKMEYGLKILKEVDFSFEPFEEYFMRFEADNNFLKGFINNELLIEVEDKSNQFEKGMIGCIVENGTIISDEISIN